LKGTSCTGLDLPVVHATHKKMTRSSRTEFTALTVPVSATRRNTTCDRKAGEGSVMPGNCRALVKRGGAESQQIQDEGEDFFNSLYPKSWLE
jgi:hypothetical protein